MRVSSCDRTSATINVLAMVAMHLGWTVFDQPSDFFPGEMPLKTATTTVNIFAGRRNEAFSFHSLQSTLALSRVDSIKTNGRNTLIISHGGQLRSEVSSSLVAPAE